MSGGPQNSTMTAVSVCLTFAPTWLFIAYARHCSTGHGKFAAPAPGTLEGQRRNCKKIAVVPNLHHGTRASTNVGYAGT